MNKLAIRTSALLLIAVLFVAPALAAQVRVPTPQTVPPVIIVSPGVVIQCSPLQAFPGSAVAGSSGFIRVECPSSGAISLDGTLTPSLQLAVGYTQAAIVMHGSSGNPCDFNFKGFPVGNATIASGHFLNQTLTFSSSPSSGQMLSSVYDYCLQFQNAPATGLASFTITWT